MDLLQQLRKPIMAVVFLALLAALWAGLIRMGWSLSPIRPYLAGIHGPLIVSGFLGTLISLERAVALSRPLSYVAPLVGALGTILLLFNSPAGAYLLVISSLGLVLVYVTILQRQFAAFTITMALGAITWLGGNIIWLAGGAIYQSVIWWVAFLVLTIVGERLEISRVLRLTPRTRLLFGLAVGIVCLGLVLSLALHGAGVRLAGLGFAALAAWLANFDIARRTVWKEGQTRYIAANLLLGYFWLFVGGILAIVYGNMMAGPYYDAWLHAIFLGFVFSMIFAHSLIILPAVSGVNIPYHPVLFGPTGLMQLGLIIRVVSDLLLWQAARRWGGMLNGLSIIWFLTTLVILALRNRRKRSEGASA